MNASPAGRLQTVAFCAAFIGCALWVGHTPAAANSMGTPEERAACQPEVFRLCSEFIPDVPKITACLKREVRNLAPPCRAVMTGKPLPRANRPAENTVR